MKKGITLLMAAFVALFMLGGCSGADGAGGATELNEEVRYGEQDLSAKSSIIETNLEWWENYVHWDGNATINVSEDEISVDVKNEGNETWSVLIEKAVDLTAGTVYTMTFEASSTVEREIEVLFDNAGYERFMNKKIIINETPQQFTFDFLMNSSQSGKIKFLMGKMEGQSDSVGEHLITLRGINLLQ